MPVDRTRCRCGRRATLSCERIYVPEGACGAPLCASCAIDDFIGTLCAACRDWQNYLDRFAAIARAAPAKRQKRGKNGKDSKG